jgi:hypothetical protein
MSDRRLVVVEITEEEQKNFCKKREELLEDRIRIRKIPVSINEINLDEWAKAFAVAAPHQGAIFDLFYFYEDGKDVMRCD